MSDNSKISDDVVQALQQKLVTSAIESKYHRAKHFEYAKKDNNWTLGVASAVFFGLSGLSVNLPTVKPITGAYSKQVAIVSIFSAITLSGAIVGKCFQLTDSGAHKLKKDHERAAKAHESIVDQGELLLIQLPNVRFNDYSEWCQARRSELLYITIPDPRSVKD